jgi:hypothetical protein
MTALRSITESHIDVNLLFVHFVLGDFIDEEIAEIGREARRAIEITNSCRHEQHPFVRALVEDSRREAILASADVHKLARGNGLCMSKSCRRDYNESAIRHYERMLLSLNMALEVAEASC